MGFVGDFIGEITGSNDARDDAISAQRGAADQANATQRYIYDQTRADMQPWRGAGERALGDLQNADFQKDFTMSDFMADPGYQFRMSEGQKAIERSAAARGGLNSGATLKALTRFGQDTASSEFSNAYNRFNADRDRRFNRLSSLAGVGQTANSQVASAGQNYGNNVSQNQIGLGNAIAGANIGASNQTSNLIGQGIGAAFMFSDRRLKTDIESVSKRELEELRKVIKAVRFRYKNEKHGAGDFIGVMAQDLEKSELGRSMVFTDPDGNKCIDLGRAVSVILASWARE